MTQQNFRTSQAHARNCNLIYHGLFADSPNPYLILTPDLKIVDANDAYLAVTWRKREMLAQQHLFDAFPDNPNDPTANGVRNLTASFDRVREGCKHDRLPLQRYDLCHLGVWQPCFWHSVNWPILDEEGAIIALVHHTKKATLAPKVNDLVDQTRRLLANTTALADSLEETAERLLPKQVRVDNR